MQPQRLASDRFLLWIDAVGGFLVHLADAVVLGQPEPPGQADVPILGDLSSRHARIRRDGEGYLVEALREVRIDGRRIEQAALLSHGNVLQLGGSVRLAFRRPHALSGTARLDFVSRHRTQPSVDAVLLMADTLILGPGARSHIVCPELREEVVLYRAEDQLHCRTQGAIEIDGTRCKDRGPIGLRSHVRGERFALSLEPAWYNKG